MKDNVLISVSGSHIYENYTEDLMEMLTPGNYYVKDGTYTISYSEAESDSSNSYTTTLTIDPNRRITIIREVKYPRIWFLSRDRNTYSTTIPSSVQ